SPEDLLSEGSPASRVFRIADSVHQVDAELAFRVDEPPEDVVGLPLGMFAKSRCAKGAIRFAPLVWVDEQVDVAREALPRANPERHRADDGELRAHALQRGERPPRCRANSDSLAGHALTEE